MLTSKGFSCPGSGSTWPHVLWQLEAMEHSALEPTIRHSNEAMEAMRSGAASAAWSRSLSILERAMAKHLAPSEFTSSLLLNQLRQRLGHEVKFGQVSNVPWEFFQCFPPLLVTLG